MSSWDTVLAGVDPEPIRGAVDPYRTAGEQSAALHRATRLIDDEFHRITSSEDLVELRGAAATQLGAVVAEIDSSLGDVPPIFDHLGGIFSRHAERLDQLRAASDQALARARTRWARVQDTRTDLADASAALDHIEAQIRELRPTAVVDPGAGARLDDLEVHRWQRRADVQAFRAASETAERWLDESRAEYGRLVEREAELVETTVREIDRIDLGALRDPNRLTRFADEVGRFLGHAGDALLDELTVLASGLAALAETVFVDALHHLARAVKTVLTAAAALAIVVLTTLSAVHPPEPTTGDLDGTFSTETRGRHETDGDDGRAVVAELLRHTADPEQIRADEFEIIRLDSGAWIVVLPGVTDLRHPHWGLSPHHASVRDTDQSALASSTSSAVADNPYAQMVIEAMRREVPPGVDVMLVGHSFGADTALDLAADPGFNGDGGYNVTHAVAAAYDSGPQLADVPDSTAVLVLQNNKDVPVLAEHAAHGPIGAIDAFGDALDAFIERDPASGVEHLGRSYDDLADTRSPRAMHEPRTVHPGPNQTQIVFDGGSLGAGHHQDNYIDYLEHSTDPALAAFLHSVGDSGYGGPRSHTAVDVSVPD